MAVGSAYCMISWKFYEVPHAAFKSLIRHTSGRFKSYRSGGSRIILRARSLLMAFIIFDKSS